jgi:hypothetical protein
MDIDFSKGQGSRCYHICEHIETEQHIFEGLQSTVGLVSRYFLSYTTGAVEWILGGGCSNF